MKKVLLLAFLLLCSGVLIACSSKENVKELPDDELLVKHWHKLSEERKTSLIKDIHNEESFHTKYDNQMDRWIMLFDAGMRNTPYHSNNLKKAMKEFNRDREITENSK